MKKIGIWIRVSTDDQARGESPEHHEQRARMYAELKGWKVEEVYHLEAVSGKSVMAHSESRRMLEDVSSGKITGLIFSKLARLARNTKELLDFSDIFQKYNADLISLHESIDTSTPAGRLFYTIIAAMAQWEREEIAERVSASVPIRAKLGKSLGGAAPFGYKKEDGKLLIDAKEAPIRKLMFELFIKEEKVHTVAKLLNERGHRTRNGAKFSRTTVDRLLRDPIAKGLRRQNYTKSLGEKKHWKLKDEKDWIFNPAPKIVSEKVWESANEILRLSDLSRVPRKRGTKNLFSGVLKCSCGGAMYVRTRSPRYVCTKCKNKIPPSDLEFIYREQLRTFLLSEEDVKKQLLRERTDITKKEEEFNINKQKLNEVTKKINDVLNLYHDGEIEKGSFKKFHAPLEKQQIQLEDRNTELIREIDSLKVHALSSDKIINDMKTLFELWETLSEDEKNRVINTITEKIVISNETPDITITMKYVPRHDPSSFELVTKGGHNLMDSYW